MSSVVAAVNPRFGRLEFASEGFRQIEKSPGMPSGKISLSGQLEGANSNNILTEKNPESDGNRKSEIDGNKVRV
jgi:hypothetical protein